jgi:small neutral amino acid transporter SnatA (MarC family)
MKLVTHITILAIAWIASIDYLVYTSEFDRLIGNPLWDLLQAVVGIVIVALWVWAARKEV